MAENKNDGKKKGFFARLIEALDKKMEAKANSCGGCCCGPAPKDGKDKKCC